MTRTTSRTVSAAIAAAIVAGIMTILPGASEQVSASAPIGIGKSDRIDVRVPDARCAAQTWPHFDAACLKDRRQPMSQARQARIVSIDRTSN